MNADGNMAYDICEDEASLEEIEGEMARSGVTQALIDETRAETENLMLADLADVAARGGDLEMLLDDQGATPVCIISFLSCIFIFISFSKECVKSLSALSYLVPVCFWAEFF